MANNYSGGKKFNANADHDDVASPNISSKPKGAKAAPAKNKQKGNKRTTGTNTGGSMGSKGGVPATPSQKKRAMPSYGKLAGM